MGALCSPVARIAISRASRMVAIPIVSASRGTKSSPKKSRVASRDRIEHDEPRAALRAGSRLVEANVPRLPDAENLEVDAARARDGVLVPATFVIDVLARDIATRDVHVPRVNVDVREQVLP